MDQEPEFVVVVNAKEAVADGVVRLTLVDPDGAPLPAWEPGAHIDLMLRQDMVRQYSLCGDPSDHGRYEIAVLREPNGRGGSAQVHDDLAEGDQLSVRGPRNNFGLVAAQRYLFLAGGVGITPLLPMVADVHRAGRDWRLVYGGRTRASMAFADELVGRYGERVTLCPQDRTGLLDLDALLGTSRADTVVYSCGPEPLLAAVEERCATWPAGTLHVERFAPKPIGEVGPDTAFEVVLSSTGRVIPVPADRSILDVLRAAGVSMAFSCTEGTCGSCETWIVDGVPDHRDSLLTEDERETSETMFVCVSRSRSPRLTLEL